MPYKDPIKQKEAKHRSYLRRKETILACNRKRRIERTIFLDEYKSKRGCYICGEKRAPCLSFHHSNGDKKYTISNMRLLAEEKLMVEIAKCVVVCRNCHAILHSKEKLINREF